MRKLLVLLTTVVAVQALSGLTAASSPPVLATGTWTFAILPETLQLVPQGQECLVHVETTVTYTGAVEGVTTSVGPVDARFFSTCDEFVAAGFVGIANVFRAVAYFVGADGTEATLVSVGRTDAAGVYEGTSSLVGDLHGVLHFTGTSGVGGTYEGRVARG
jgi:hypothetical protein